MRKVSESRRIEKLRCRLVHADAGDSAPGRSFPPRTKVGRDGRQGLAAACGSALIRPPGVGFLEAGRFVDVSPKHDKERLLGLLVKYVGNKGHETYPKKRQPQTGTSKGGRREN